MRRFKCWKRGRHDDEVMWSRRYIYIEYVEYLLRCRRCHRTEHRIVPT